MFWKHTVEVKIQSFSQGHIDSIVCSGDVTWSFTGFYGNPDRNLRHLSWKLLDRLGSIPELSNLAWLVGGDFNEILHNMEKKGGNPRGLGGMEQFYVSLLSYGLCDTNEDAWEYTWHNRRKKEEGIAAGLDRFTASESWRKLFPRARMRTLDLYGSDHRPIWMQLEVRRAPRPDSKPKRFHFEHKWLLDRNFDVDFLSEWEYLRGQGSLSNILNGCQLFLQRWAGKKFDDMGKKIR